MQNPRSPTKESFAYTMCFLVGLSTTSVSLFRILFLLAETPQNLLLEDRLIVLSGSDSFYIALILFTVGAVCFGVGAVIHRIDNLGGD